MNFLLDLKNNNNLSLDVCLFVCLTNIKYDLNDPSYIRFIKKIIPI
jgi:hypothetical protein